MKTSKGFALAEMFIFIALSTLIALGVFYTFNKVVRVQKWEMQRSDINELQIMILRQLSCIDTLDSCIDGQETDLSLKNSRGKIFASKRSDGFFQLDQYLLQSICTSDGKLVISYKPLRNLKSSWIPLSSIHFCEKTQPIITQCSDQELPKGIGANGYVECSSLLVDKVDFKTIKFIDHPEETMFVGEGCNRNRQHSNDHYLTMIIPNTTMGKLAIGCSGTFPNSADPSKTCCKNEITNTINRCSLIYKNFDPLPPNYL